MPDKRMPAVDKSKDSSSSTVWECHFEHSDTKRRARQALERSLVVSLDEERQKPKKDPSDELIELLVSELELVRPKDDQSMSSDTKSLRKSISAIWETSKEEILTESEARLLIEFLVSRFIERRFTGMIQGMFPAPGKKWFMRYKRTLR